MKLFSYDSKFSQVLLKISYGCCLNLLWFLFSLPVITIGASTTALYYVSFKIVREEEHGIIKSMNPPPPGKQGLIVVRSPQVMKGYLKDEEKTNNVVFITEGRRWYKTGDKCIITEEGFVKILGRYSRFAKLGGEMISLTAVELRIGETKILDGKEFAVTAVPDSSKGERIVLLVKEAEDPEDIAR